MSDRLAHVYPQLDVAYSVLFEVEIVAPCGDVRVMTRESVDSAGEKPVCHKCIDAIEAEVDDFRIHGARGWVAYLERIVTAALTPPQAATEAPDGQ